MNFYKWLICIVLILSGYPLHSAVGATDQAPPGPAQERTDEYSYISKNFKAAAVRMLRFFQNHPTPDSLIVLLDRMLPNGGNGELLRLDQAGSGLLTQRIQNMGENRDSIPYILDQIITVIGGDSMLLASDSRIKSRFLFELVKFRESIDGAFTINRLIQDFRHRPIVFYIDNDGFDLALEYDLEGDVDKSNLPFLMFSEMFKLKFAELHRKQGNLEKASEVIGLAKTFGAFDEVPRKRALLEIQEGKLKLAMGKPAEAIQHCQTALEISQKVEVRINELSACKCLYEGYSALEMHGKALVHRMRFEELNAAFLKNNTVRRLSFLQFDFTGAKYQQALLKQRQQEQEITDERLKNAQQLRNGLILIILLTSISLFLLYRISRNRKKAKEAIQQSLLEKEALIKEIHHRIKNNLQMVSGLLDLQTQFLDDQDAKNALTEGQSRLNSVALIHEQLYADDNRTSIAMHEYIQELVSEMEHSFGLEEKGIAIETQLKKVELDVKQAIPLGLILHELVNNSVKYAFANEDQGRIEVHLRQEKDDAVQLRVSDNGIGMAAQSRADLRKSYGWRMVHLFTETLHGTINVQGESGTVVELNFPFEG